MSALKASSEPSKLSSWRNDIQSLVKKCRILALYFFPKRRIGVECLTRGVQSSRWPLHYIKLTNLYHSFPNTPVRTIIAQNVCLFTPEGLVAFWLIIVTPVIQWQNHSLESSQGVILYDAIIFLTGISKYPHSHSGLEETSRCREYRTFNVALHAQWTKM
jgi:hypothetical protein